MEYAAVAIGCSMGGLKILTRILHDLPDNFSLPIVILSHLDSNSDSLLPEILARETVLPVHQASVDMKLSAGHIYVAPPAYHLYVENDLSFSFSLDAKVSYSRPSIDVLFESMADVFGPQLIGVLLTGANSDGAQGLKHIRNMGGVSIIQDPTRAEAAMMPLSGLEQAGADFLLSDDEIAGTLVQLSRKHIRVIEK